jgi:hypothetical protein
MVGGKMLRIAVYDRYDKKWWSDPYPRVLANVDSHYVDFLVRRGKIGYGKHYSRAVLRISLPDCTHLYYHNSKQITCKQADRLFDTTPDELYEVF